MRPLDERPGWAQAAPLTSGRLSTVNKVEGTTWPDVVSGEFLLDWVFFVFLRLRT